MFAKVAIILSLISACRASTGSYHFWPNEPFISERRQVRCYDESGRAQRCFTPFVNAAFESKVEVTNTCGNDGPEEYCEQSGVSGGTRTCDICYNTSFPPRYLTDFHSLDNLTWWQSSTMMHNVQWPNSINLTIHLGKAFEITYVRLRFHSSQPESYAIYKRARSDGPWIPYQFYSNSCFQTYNLPNNEIVKRDNEAQAICRDDFSDITPLTGASVAFSTLEGRPSAYDFDSSSVLQEWVTSADIKIVLNRINTFRDEVFGDPSVLKSYYYAISDIAIGGRCKCNGHASECINNMCKCEHNTTGPDCDQCLPFYNDKPWRRAIATDANECLPCNCNGLSERCYFDRKLFDRTGHGGHCTDCRDNAEGPYCEYCKVGFYRRDERDRCYPCNCNPLGTKGEQCDNNGACLCKHGVTGDKCDRCLPNYFGFGSSGCRTCECSLAGSLDNNPECISENGLCRCKENVQGQNCDICKPGYFGLNADDPLGCTRCFCYGHSNKCSSSTGYYIQVIHSDFKSGLQGWSGVNENNEDTSLDLNVVGQAVGITSLSQAPMYFNAPARYLGDQKSSYNLFLSFDLRIGEESSQISSADLIVEGVNGQMIYTSITSQYNPPPRIVTHNYKFRLNEHPRYGWSPSISTHEFISILSNIKSIKMRGTFSYQGHGFIDNVKLESVSPGVGRIPALNVERCECPDGYVGQFCESCAPAYRREPGHSDAFTRCIPCDCNGHSDDCDPVYGQCICQHNTAGRNCEKCAPGFYGNALASTQYDCRPCPCPNQGQCLELTNGEVACTECQIGYSGNRCEQCADGYFGDPEGTRGPRRHCEKCTCNDNIDPNAIGTCDRWTGECLKCIYNTAGFSCDHCLPDHYGNALTYPKGQCQPCDCYIPGTTHQGGDSCNIHTGQCHCKPNVYGLKCDHCLQGYWNIDGPSDCERCDCDRIGSYNSSCDFKTGRCYCKPGVTGDRCDSCAEKYYGFSPSGCFICDCNAEGSLHEQCDPTTGKCICKPNIEGRTCDRCAENRFLSGGQCIECPECYILVQQTANEVRVKVNDLRILINYINNDPFGHSNDIDFRRKLHYVNQSVVQLYWDARGYRSGGIHGESDELNAIQTAIYDLLRVITTVQSNIETAQQHGDRSRLEVKSAEDMVNEIDRKLREAERKVTDEGRMLLRRAFEAQHRQGYKSESLTRIANEARNIVEGQERDVVSTEEILNRALSISEEALRLAEQVAERTGSVSTEIITIQRKITELRSIKQRIDRDARVSLENAMRVYNESLSTLFEITSIDTPLFNFSIEDRLSNFKREAELLEREVHTYIGKNERLVLEIDNMFRLGEHSFYKAQTEQQILDELLATADALKGQAQDNIIKCTTIYQEALNTLRTLEAFDNTIQQSKLEADRALQKKWMIIRNIQDAEMKTNQTRQNLANAENDARHAKDDADRARRIAEESLRTLESIMNETSTTREKIVNIKEETVKLTVKMEDVEKRLSNLEETAKEDAKTIAEAQGKADLAKSKATQASEGLIETRRSVMFILEQLNSVEVLDTTQLDILELELNSTEMRLNAVKGFSDFNQMKQYDFQVSIWIDDYTQQMTQFQLDLENIRHINTTIPRTCFKILNLEPTESKNPYSFN